MKILLEHDNTPNTTYNDVLLFGGSNGAILNEMVNINESADLSNKEVRFKGKFQEAEATNKNKRIYPYDILSENVSRLNECIKTGGLVGELDHPTDSIIHFKEASHKIVKLWWEDKILMGEGVILNTPSGKVLRSLINDGVRIGISSRGVGNGKVNENGILVIGESYKLITFDAVADPSTHEAFQEKVSGKTENISSQPVLNNSIAKNEGSCIHNTINPDLLAACLSGLFKEETMRITKRIKRG